MTRHGIPAVLASPQHPEAPSPHRPIAPSSATEPEMPYDVLATSHTPALIIYLLDVSASMRLPLGGRRRLDVMLEALDAVIEEMVSRSMTGENISSRYKIGMLAYSDGVHDLLDGVRTIEYVANRGAPELEVMRKSEAALAFAEAERMLLAELPLLQRGPAPLVCHLTDGEYTGPDPEPIVDRIKALSVADGNVLVENIFISDKIVTAPIQDARTWTGITRDTPFAADYALKLRSMSSVLPDTYCTWLNESGYHITPGAYMMLPGESPELVALGFQMSRASDLKPDLARPR